MKMTITKDIFINEFKTSEERKNNFSYEALEAIYNYLTEIEEATGNEVEFDIIAVCCVFTEFETEAELLKCYDYNYNISKIQELTFCEKLPNGGYVIQNF
jgi:hypothetical protein